jgi:hypothetical protein
MRRFLVSIGIVLALLYGWIYLTGDKDEWDD